MELGHEYEQDGKLMVVIEVMPNGSYISAPKPVEQPKRRKKNEQ